MFDDCEDRDVLNAGPAGDPGYEGIPAALDEMEPGPYLAAILASVHHEHLTGHDRVVVLRAHQRMASHYAARLYEDMSAISDAIAELDDDPQLATEAAAAEIRVALCLTRRAADTELDFALSLRRRLPRLFQLLAAGVIDARRARVITQNTRHLPITTARHILDQIIETAPTMTTGQLTAHLRRLTIEADPADATNRYADAISDRRISTQPTPDGTSHLFAFDLPPDRVGAITRRINHLARTLKTGTEPRTMDQLRADVFVDLLTGTPTDGRGAVVDIQVDLTTLTQLADHPGNLAGYGPVIADIARRVAEDQSRAQWRYTITHPGSGDVLTTGTTRRRPTAPDQRLIHAQDPTCIFPGCRMPATSCDLDHRILHTEGGPPHPDNLAPLCRHDHRLRHQAGWTHEPLPSGGHQWTSKLGHTYTTKPP